MALKKSHPRNIVVISGAPGAGKTSVAKPLAQALGFALISKDHIKETLHDALDGPSRDLQWSRRIGGAAMELLWMLAARCPQVVMEANFRPHSGYERSQLRRLGVPLVEVHCQCPAAESARRFARRAEDAHPAHALRTLPADLLAEYDRPLGLDHLITVDTTREVDISGLATNIIQIFDAWRLSGSTPQR